MSRRAVAGAVAAGMAAGCLVLLAGCGEEGAGTRVSPTGVPDVSLPPATEAPVTADFLDPCPTSRAVPARGDGLPDLTLPCLGPGDAVTLSGVRGRPTLVNVWASWCPPCRGELPWLQRVYDDGVAVLGVDAEDQPGAAASLLQSLAVTFPSVSDPGNQFATAMGLPLKPTTLFVAADGEVVYVHTGPFASETQLRELVATHLGVTAR